jgi:hypothetical protein
MKYGRTIVALTALVVAAGCSSGDLNQPVSPDGVSSASKVATSLASAARSGSLQTQKDCSNYFTNDTCTITQSNLKEIEVGSVVHYLQKANPDFTVSSYVFLDPPGPGNNRAFGHCNVNLITGLGECVFSGGTGKFTFFNARVDVTPVGGPVFAWSGTYSYSH